MGVPRLDAIRILDVDSAGPRRHGDQRQDERDPDEYGDQRNGHYLRRSEALLNARKQAQTG